MHSRYDPAGTRLPIKLDTTTNGEFAPIPLEPMHRHARHLALKAATANARRQNVTRRGFLVSACGAATMLLGMNTAYAAGGRRGSYYELPADAALDLQLARSTLDGAEFIFDVQGHFVNPTGAWTRSLPAGAQPLKSFAQNKRCAAAEQPGLDYLQCLGPDEFIKDIFLDSDTDLIVLSFVPSTRKGEPLTIEEAAATAR
ncbi:MAG: amidohydrolase family protein, partial [Casimicrobiaceae bacterium]